MSYESEPTLAPDDTSLLEYLVAGGVVLFFGLLYWFLNHSPSLTSNAAQAPQPQSVAASSFAIGTANTEPPQALKLSQAASEQAYWPKPEPIKVPARLQEQVATQAKAEQDAKTTVGAAQTESVNAAVPSEQLQALREEMAQQQAAELDKLRAEWSEQQQTALDRLRAEMAAKQKARLDALRQSLSQETPQNTATDSLAVVDESSNEPSVETPQKRLALPDGEQIEVDTSEFERTLRRYLAENISDEPLIFDKVEFESGSAQLNAQSQAQIKVVAALLNRYPDAQVLVRGHTDNVGDIQNNSLLSLNRSNSMKTALTDLGIEPERIRIEGVGPLYPIASNDTPEGREKNRRIELMLVAPQAQ